MTRARTAVIALLFVALLFGASGYTYARTSMHRWHITARDVCMNAEDSAAHLRLRTYDRATHTATYGCWHTGY